jgi:molecular chaperone GrpE
VTNTHQADSVEVSEINLLEPAQNITIDTVTSDSGSAQLESDQQPTNDTSVVCEQNIISIQETVSTIVQMLSGLSTDFETKIKYDDSKERTINLLHQELQDYRNDLNFQHLRPLMLELMSLYDDMSLIANKDRTEGQSIEIVSTSSPIIGFMQDIEDMLNRHGFEIYQTDSSVFDRTLQNAQKTVNTDNPNLDRHIVNRGRKGLRYGERIMRPEAVTVYRYQVSSVNQTSEV